MTDRDILDGKRWNLDDEPGPTVGHALHDESPERALFDDPILTEALALSAARGRLSAAEVRDQRARRRRRVVAGAGGIGALLAILGLGIEIGAWQHANRTQTAHLETARGQTRSVRLADGSELKLSGATSLDIKFEGSMRQIELVRGEAYFDIAHDALRPFEVRAGRSSTRVLGTAFDLDLGGTDVRLAVYRGRVRFGPTSPTDNGQTVLVPQGWRTGFRGNSPQVPTQFDTSQQDWRSGWLDTDSLRLDDLVTVLNRGSGPPVIAPPPQLAAIKLAGRFHLDDPRQLLESFGSVYGFKVRSQAGSIRLEPLSEAENAPLHTPAGR